MPCLRCSSHQCVTKTSPQGVLQSFPEPPRSTALGAASGVGLSPEGHRHAHLDEQDGEPNPKGHERYPELQELGVDVPERQIPVRQRSNQFRHHSR